MRTFTSCGCGSAACGCCSGIQTSTPQNVGSAPGKSALSVRIGRHGDFLASMLAGLSTYVDEDGNSPLKRLRTRQSDDLTISLLDAFAASGDVLAFYNERIANEGYLATATDFRSVESLADLVGYRPQPGVSASVFLAFEIDSNVTGPVRVEKGLGVKTVPGQDELPQVFETSDVLEARAEWNKLGLRLTVPQMIVPEEPGTLWLEGTDCNLNAGDALLVESPPEPVPVPVRVLSAVADLEAKRTKVLFEPWMLDDTLLAKLIDGGARLGDNKLSSLIEEAREISGMPRLAAADALKALAVNAGKVQPTAAASKKFVADMIRFADKLAGAILPVPPGKPLPPANFDTRLQILSRPPAAAPASAASVARSIGTGFQRTSAATLGIVAKAAPAAAAQLEQAVAGHVLEAPAQTQKVYAMRVRAGVFGRTFPKKMHAARGTDEVGPVEEVGEWPIIIEDRAHAEDPSWTGREQPNLVMLDATYDAIAPQSWIMIDTRGLERTDTNNGVRVGPTESLLVTRALEVMPKISRADYGGSADGTAIRLPALDPWIVYGKRDGNAPVNQPLIDREFQLIRRTIVYAAAEELVLAEQPIDGDFCLGRDDAPHVVELDTFYPGLVPGRYVIVSGERADIPDTDGVLASEVAMIAEVQNDVSYVGEGDGRRARAGDRVHSFITFANPLSYCYKRSSVVIRGNVVKATHGETRQEVLGGGDGSASNLSLPLKQAPLTFLAAPNAHGADAALQIWVDDILWREADDLLDCGPTDRVYLLKTSQGGKAAVQFGDGKEGARPPTGTQNIRSVYRTGIGRPGDVQAGQISQLVTRPAGLTGVINPLPATGGADAEAIDQVRRNAPLMTIGLDRLVSVQDHASFARRFAGIAKAQARTITDGSRRLVHVTVAAEGDAPLDDSSDLMIALKEAFADFGDPYSPVILAPRELRLLIVAARIRIEPDRLWDVVVADIRRRLGATFGFEGREIASGLAASPVLALIQGTPGVAYVELDTFGSIPTVEAQGGIRAPLGPSRIADEIQRVCQNGVARWEPARPARMEAGVMAPAELLLLSIDIADTLILNELT